MVKLLDLLAAAQREFRARDGEQKLAAGRLARLETELERERRRADALARIGQAGNAVREMPALLQLIVDVAVKATGAERGLIVVPDPVAERPQARAACNLDTTLLPRPEFGVSRSTIERVFRDGDPLVTTDSADQPDTGTGNHVRSLHVRSIVCVPIKNKTGIVGVLYVDSRIGAGDHLHDDPQLLETIAAQAAVAIDNARLYDDLSKSFGALSTVKSQSDEILEAIASGVVVLDDGNSITQFNRAAEMTFGLSASTLVGRDAGILNTWVGGFSESLERFKREPSGRIQTEVTGNHFIRGRLVLQVTFFRVSDPQGDRCGVAVVLNDLTESRALEAENQAQLVQSRRVARSFERYLAPHVVSGLLKNPEAIVLGGTRQTATMLFADIRGFTELSERLMPEQVVELLNRYLAPVVNVIFSNLGLLDKFYGDGIMAVFGAPRPSADDAVRATVAARQILEQVNRLNGRPDVTWPLSVSIGLATGEVVAGHIGSEQRLEYTVIGNAVNLASRLQNMAEPNQILADEATYDKVKDQLTATRRLARIRGKAALTPVYVLHG